MRDIIDEYIKWLAGLVNNDLVFSIFTFLFIVWFIHGMYQMNKEACEEIDAMELVEKMVDWRNEENEN